MSVMASASAWGLGQWESMEEYCKSISENTPEGAFFQALMDIHKGHFAGAQEVNMNTPTVHISLYISYEPGRVHIII